MKFRRLRTDYQLNQYRFIMQKFIDVLLPLGYLKQGKVIAAYDKNDHMCGGFAIILNGPYRVLESIPKKTSAVSFLNKASTAEITGLWLDSKINDKKQSLQLWLKVLVELLTCKKEYFVYAYSLSKPALGKIYSVAKPQTLFKGETKKLQGMSTTDNESVEYITLPSLLLAPFLNPQFILSRFKGRRSNRVACYE